MRAVQDLRMRVRNRHHHGKKYFKTLRQMTAFPFIFNGLQRLNMSSWLKSNLRRISRQRNCIFDNWLRLTGLKAQIIFRVIKE